MDDINDQLNKLSRELDTLDEGTGKYQVRQSTEGIATVIPSVKIMHFYQRKMPKML